MVDLVTQNVSQGTRTKNGANFTGVNYLGNCGDGNNAPSCLLGGSEGGGEVNCNLFENGCDSRFSIQTATNVAGQTNPEEVTGPGFISCGHNKAQRGCAFMDVNLCVLTESDGNFKYMSDNPNNLGWKWKNPVGGTQGRLTMDGLIECSWPKETFFNQGPVEAFVKKFKGPTLIKGSTLDENVYPTFCGQKNTVRSPAGGLSPIQPSDQSEEITPPTTSGTGVTSLSMCPIDKFGTLTEMPECSFFKTTLPEVVKDETTPQDICDVWVREGSTARVDEIMTDFCNVENPTLDCRCLNPLSLDPDIKKIIGIRPNLATSVGCWYFPCGKETGASYLQTSDIEKQQARCDKANVCNVVLNAIAKGNINIDNVKESIDCDFNGPPPSNGGFTFTQIIIGIVILVSFIIVIAIIIAFTSGTSKKK